MMSMWCRRGAVRAARAWGARAASAGGMRVHEEESPLRRLLRDASAFGEDAPAERELQWATQPYAAEPPREHQRAPAPAPRDATVLLFPGQGSHYVGMGLKLREVPAARDLYELASSVLGWDVWRVCTAGPAEALAARAQAAVLVTSLAALEAARETRPGAVERAQAAAGFSLGEFAALVFAGALPLEGALRVVAVREAAMLAAAAARPQGMLTLWLAPGADLPRLLAEARAAAAEAGVADPVCQVANYLYPGCKVIAGDEQALAYVERLGCARGVRRAARVDVRCACHTPLQARAEEAVREALRLVPAAAPRLRVLQCAEARAYRDAADVRRGLARLTTRAVRWEQTLHALYARPRDLAQPLTLALGPGAATRSTLKQVNARAWDASLHVPA